MFRQWGVEDAIRARGLPDDADVFVFAESIAGREIGRTRPEPDLAQGPAWKSMVAQDVVEEELLRALDNARHARVRFSTEFVGFEATEAGVTVELRTPDTDEPERVEAIYLIAADGAGSPTRRAAGIDMDGPASLRLMLNEYWRGDLTRFPAARSITAYRILPPDRNVPPGNILNTDGTDRWLSILTIGVDDDDRPRPWTDGETIELIRQHIGVPDQPVELINRSQWRFSKQVAATFRRGRLFLVGDAAHWFAPTGGTGLNSGVQDAHNLAWKLAFVLGGKASARLLGSYDCERRPVARSNAEWSYGNYVRMFDIEESLRSNNADEIRFRLLDQEHHIHSIGQVLGYSYREGAVVSDGTTRHPLDARTYTPTDQPGARFPHIWLDTARQVSTLDWFDKDFALVTGPAGDAWLEAGGAVAKQLGVPLDLHRLPAAEPDAGFHMGPRGAALVRPDGHVGFRMAWTPADPARELAGALTTLLA